MTALTVGGHGEVITVFTDGLAKRTIKQTSKHSMLRRSNAHNGAMSSQIAARPPVGEARESRTTVCDTRRWSEGIDLC